MNQKLKIFKENEMQTKDDVLFSMRSVYEEGVFNGEFSPYVKKLIYDFIRQIEFMKLPKCNDWWFYLYEITNFGIELKMHHCNSIDYEEDGSKITVDQTIKIAEKCCKMITVSEFAKIHNVKPVTVRQWIRRGKLRAIKKQGNDWLVSEIAEKPHRKYKPVIYTWNNEDKSLCEKFYFLKGANNLSISQNEKNKTLYDVVVGDKLKLEITTSEREKLELSLLATKDIQIDENTIFISRWSDYKKIPFSMKTTPCKIQNLDYGPVLVVSGKHKGKIGIYDGDDYEKAIVYFGDMLLHNNYYLIPFQYLTDTITISDTINRINKLRNEIIKNEYDAYYKNECFNELLLCSNLLESKYRDAITNINTKRNHKIFISHSSQELHIARAIATDFINDGFEVFLDDWSVDLGENIINSISDAIENSHSLILLVSKDYLRSAYCMDEWTSFYMKYSKIYKNSIYPIMINDTEPPALFAAIKYTRINNKHEYDYKNAYTQIVKAINKRTGNNKSK